MARQRILLAEDEPVSRRFLLDGLHALGYAPEALAGRCLPRAGMLQA
jgi:hypothetical protein